jgi:hypothetical protein
MNTPDVRSTSLWHHPGAVAGVCLALSMLCFAPRLWLMTEYLPGTFQWDRAHTYLLQCEHPLRRDVEAAMLWRLLPPLVAHAAHLPGKTPLALPWLGVFACTAYVAVLFRRRLPDPRYVYGGTLLFATTSAVLVPVGWFGINDAWIWLGLLAVSFGESAWALPLATLLCPWVDERFIIGFPLAWLVRCLDRDDPPWSRAALQGLWLMPYVAIRLALGGNPAGGGASTSFLHAQLSTTAVIAPFAPLAWWMALRAGWAAVALGFWSLPIARRWLAGVVVGITLLVMLGLASDMSRSAAILTPTVLWGCFVLARRFPAQAPRVLLAAGLINLLLPAVHVVHTKIDLINPLPLELFRVLRGG